MSSAHHSLSLKVATIIIINNIFFFSFTAPSENVATFSKQYGPFNNITYYRTILEVISPATINNNVLQLTPDVAVTKDIFSMYNLSGRVLLRQPFKLWDRDINSDKITTVASFNSSFLVNIYRPNNDAPGEGMAFIVAPNLVLPPESFGEFLGVTNATTDGNSTNKIVAVELDTFKQDFDPDHNHLGLNVNSVQSKKTESLISHSINIAADGTRFYNVWVNYDGVEKMIQVFMVEQINIGDPTPPMPNSPLLKTELDLQQFVQQISYFGFSASTGTTMELNSVLRWNLTVAYFPVKKEHRIPIVGYIFVPVVMLILLGFLVMGYYYLHKKRRDKQVISPNILKALRSLPGTPREFEFKDSKRATNNFDERLKLGQGGYGVVYKCVLLEENLEVAVKWFNRESLKGEDDFLAELTIINRLRHRNLVRLLGWCHKSGKLLLLYEYMPNGSLDMHLFAGPNKPPLSWPLRYNIISGVASALHYLHNEYDVRVVHRDLKASNILLDSKFDARLGDFGLARALDNEKTSYLEAEGVIGTIGYIAPEIFLTAKATQQSDIYAFGAVLIEVVCGRRPRTKIGSFQFLVDWVWSLYRQGRILDAVDQRLGGDYAAEEAKRILMLGLACSHPIACERPKTQAIVQVISGSAPAPQVPLFKPSFVWPAVVPPNGDISWDNTVHISTQPLSAPPRILSAEDEVRTISATTTMRDILTALWRSSF